MNSWKKLSSRTVYENPWITLSEDEVINPGGTETVYSTINTKTPVVYVAAVDENKNVHMVLRGEMYDPHSFSGVIAALNHIQRKNKSGGEV